DLDRLTTMAQDPTGLQLATTHGYDENGNETSLLDPKGQSTISTYDEWNRLKSKTFAFAPNDPYRPWRYTSSISYVNDANDNLVEVAGALASGPDPPPTTPNQRTEIELLGGPRHGFQDAMCVNDQVVAALRSRPVPAELRTSNAHCSPCVPLVFG